MMSQVDQLTILSKDKSKELSEVTRPVLTFLQPDKTVVSLMFDVLNFAHLNGIPENQPFKEKRKVLSNLLGGDPSYQIRNNFLAAVWGVRHQDIEFMIVYSNRGFSLEFPWFVREEEVMIMLQKIHAVLIPEKNASENLEVEKETKI